MQPVQVYSISEAARILGISTKTLRRWDKSGKIKIGRTPGGSRVFSKNDLDSIKSYITPSPVEIPQNKISLPKFPKINFNFAKITVAFLIIGLILANSFLLSKTDYPKQAVLGVQDFVAPVVQEVSPLLSPLTRFVSNLGNSVRLGIGTFLLSLLPLDFQTKTEGEGSTTNTTIVQSGDIPSDLVLSSLTVDNNGTIGGNLLVAGTINTNTFTGNRLIFSGSSPSIYPSTTNSQISLNANGTGAINIGNSGTGDVYIAGGSGDGGCTITNNSGTLNCSGNITTAGDLIANGGDILTDLSTLTLGNSSQTVRIPGTLTITKAPTLPHTGTWSIGASSWNVSDSSFYINPSTATADSNLFGLAINGAVRFAVDAEGDTYVNNLILAGNITSATTTVSGDLTVEGNTTLGDSTTDTITLNPATITLAGGNKTLDLTGAATRTLTILNSTSSQVTDLDLSDGSLKLAGTTRISNAGGGTLDNLTVNPSSSSQVALTIKGATSQSVDLLQIKNSLDAVIAKVDQLGNITGNTLTSTVATGTAPLTVSSTTVVSNLNVSQLEGYTASNLYSQPQPNLVLNSDFGRRNKWMTFMPEVFSDTSGIVSVILGSGTGSVASNYLTGGTVDLDGNRWMATMGLGTWRDARFSAQIEYNGRAIAVGIASDANNLVAAYQNAANFTIYKRVAGTFTAVATVAHAPVNGNDYWLELEKQGTKFIAKVYSSGTSAVAKSSATLVHTLTGDITDGPTAGYLLLWDEGTATRSKWGGLSTGDGGVYVEGWGPESIGDVAFNGTKGGQALGFDESTDAGPLGKQWALRFYVPATDRRISLNGTDLTRSKSDAVPSTAYTASLYRNFSGLGGSGTMLRMRVVEEDAALGNFVTTSLNDAAESSWTRANTTFTTASTTRKIGYVLDINPNSTRTGTAFFMLPQVEQGSIVTPWRNAPADDNDIMWSRNLFEDRSTGYSISASGSWTEISPNLGAVNVFLPWDATVEVIFSSGATNDTNAAQLRATICGNAQTVSFNDVLGTTIEPFWMNSMPTPGAGNFDNGNANVSAGKCRIAVEQLHSAGTLTIYTGPRAIFAVRAKRGRFDLAEEYSVEDQSIEGGDVIRLSSLGGTTVEKVDKGYDQSILGIVSTDPGITLSSTVELNGYREKPNLRPVALQGRVPVKVTSENGVIKRGDILTSSASKPGYAMKATKAGRSIGIAMEDFAPQEQSTIYDLPLTSDESSTSSGQIVNSQPSIVTGKIMTFVNLSFYDPDVYLADSGQLVIQKTQNTQIAGVSDDLTIGDSETSDSLSFPSIPKFSLFNTQTKEVIERTGAFNDLFVANLKVGRLDASEITSIDDLRLTIDDLKKRINNLELATSSAVLSASISGLLNEEEATNSGTLNSLIVSGKTILSDLGVTGTITNGLLSIDGLNSSINSLTDFRITVPGGEILIDKDGNLNVSNKITAQKVEAEIFISSKASGSGILPANTASVEIISENATETAKILITPTTLTNKVLTVTQKGVGKFIVSVKEADIQDIKFDWFIIQ